jgi:hypothetical protein
MTTKSFFSLFISKITANIKANKSVYILLAAIVGLLSLFFGIRYLTEKTSSIHDVRVTNITGTSATVTWVSDSPVKGSVIYSQSDSWFPVFEHVGKTRAYDDRDTEEVEYGVYRLEEWGEYYVHHVTLRDLEPSSRYYYRISAGMKSVDYDYPTLVTTDVRDDVVSPEPVYGQIVIDEKGKSIDGALVFIQLEELPTDVSDLSNTRKSQVYSTYTNETLGWSLDISGIRDEGLSRMFNESRFNVYIDVYAGAEKKEDIVVDADKLQPVRNIVIQGIAETEIGTSRNPLVKEVYAVSCEPGQTPCSADCCPDGWCFGEGCYYGTCTQRKNQACEKHQKDDDGDDGGDSGDGGDDGSCVKHTCHGDYACYDGKTCGNCYDDKPCSCKNKDGTDCGYVDAGKTCNCPTSADGDGNTGANNDNGNTNNEVATSTDWHPSYWGGQGDYCNGDSLYNCTGTSVANSVCNIKKVCTGSCYKAEAGKNDYCVEAEQEKELDPASCEIGKNYKMGEVPEACLSLPDCPQNATCYDKYVSGLDTGKCKRKIGATNYSYNIFYGCSYSVSEDQREVIEEFGAGYYCNGDILYYCDSADDCDLEQDCGLNGCCEMPEGVADKCCTSDQDIVGDLVDEGVNCPHKDEVMFLKGSTLICAQPGVFEYDEKTGECVKNYYIRRDNNWVDARITRNCNVSSETCVAGSGISIGCETVDRSCEKATKSVKPPGMASLSFNLPREEAGLYPFRDITNRWACDWDCNSSWKGLADTCVKKQEDIEIPVSGSCSSCSVSDICQDKCDKESNWLSTFSKDYSINAVIGRVVCYRRIASHIKTFEGDCYGFTDVNTNPNNLGSASWLAVSSACYALASEKDELRKNSPFKIHDGSCVGDGSSAKVDKGNIYESDRVNSGGGIINKVSAEEGEDVIHESGIYRVEGVDIGSENNEITLTIEQDEDNVRVRFFEDVDEDGAKDNNEDYIDEVAVKLVKENDLIEYDLGVGWNLISFAIVSDSDFSAKKLLELITQSGGYATHVATYRDGKWVMYSQRGDVSYTDDFNILPGVGYFVRMHKETSLNISGNRFSESLPLDLQTGWNLVGVVTPDASYTADSLIDAIVEDGIIADTVTKWDSGRYSNFIKEGDLSYGNDFGIFEIGGYFIRVKSEGGRFTP